MHLAGAYAARSCLCDSHVKYRQHAMTSADRIMLAAVKRRISMSLKYLKAAVAEHDTEKLIRYIRLHLGDGNEAAGRKEIDKAWIEALKLLLDVPATDREFICSTLKHQPPETLAHLYFYLHFYFVQRSGAWIHDGTF